MRVSKKTPISIVSSTIPLETGFLWNNVTTYAPGDFVCFYEVDENQAYFYLAGKTNVNIAPTDQSVWTKVSPTNRWAMFSEEFNSATTTDERLQVGIQCFGAADVISLAGVVASYVDIYIYASEGGTLLETLQIMPVDYAALDAELMLSGDATFYNQFFEYFSSTYSSPYLFLDFVPISGVTTVCGKVFVGKTSYLGKTQYGTNIGSKDYSKKIIDDFGTFTLEQGTYSRIVGSKVHIEDSLADEVVSKLSSITATPVVWDLNNEDTDFLALKIYGFPRSWELTLGMPNATYVDVEVNTPASKGEQTFFYLRVSKLTGQVIFGSTEIPEIPSLQVSKLTGQSIFGDIWVPEIPDAGVSKLTGTLVIKKGASIDPEQSKTALLLPFDFDYSDYSELGVEIYKLDGCYLSHTNYAVGSGSLYFSGDSSGLYTNHYPEADLRTEDFTIEFWVNPSSSADFTVFQALFCKLPGFVIGISDGGSPYVNIQYMDIAEQEAVVPLTDSDGILLSVDLWNHLAFSRVGTSLHCFLNGQLRKTISLAGATIFEPEISHLGFWLGAYEGGSMPFVGYMDAVRYTYQLGRYTTDFVPSTQPFIVD